jgi:hypothetical protein
MSVLHETPREAIERRNREIITQSGGAERARRQRNLEMECERLGLPIRIRKKDKLILVMNLALFIFTLWYFFGGGGPLIDSYLHTKPPVKSSTQVRTTLTGNSSNRYGAPTIRFFQPQVSGHAVSFNGVMLPTAPRATIPGPAFWNFGDGDAWVTSWFPAQHFFAHSGTYHVTVTARDSNGFTASTSVNVMVQ